MSMTVPSFPGRWQLKTGFLALTLHPQLLNQILTWGLAPRVGSRPPHHHGAASHAGLFVGPISHPVLLALLLCYGMGESPAGSGLPVAPHPWAAALLVMLHHGDMVRLCTEARSAACS